MKAMQKSKSRKLMLLFVTMASVLAFCATASLAQAKVKVNFRAFAVVTKMERFEVGDTPGHVVSILENKGVTSDGKFVRYFTSRSDLIKGNGTLSGYGNYVEVKDGDAYFVKFNGSVSTTKSPEGKLKITFKGTYSYTKGTGKYENIQGDGTFSGGYIGKGIMSVDVEGEYSIKK
jgi:hypothetical protein